MSARECTSGKLSGKQEPLARGRRTGESSLTFGRNRRNVIIDLPQRQRVSVVSNRPQASRPPTTLNLVYSSIVQ